MASKPYDWKPAFLAALRNVPVIAHACAVVDIERSTAWRAREADEAFAKAMDDALEDGVDKAEQEAFRRAVTGFSEPVVHQGRISWVYEPYEAPDGATQYRPMRDANNQPIPLTITKHSDALLSLILKGRRKKVYAERTEITGADGNALAIDETARSARVAQLLATARKRQLQDDDFADLA